MERTPFTSDNQIGSSIAVQVAEDRATDQAQLFEWLGWHETATFIAQPLGERRLGVTSGNDASADEQIQITVTIHIGNSQGASAGERSQHAFAARASLHIIDAHA